MSPAERRCSAWPRCQSEALRGMRDRDPVIDFPLASSPSGKFRFAATPRSVVPCSVAVQFTQAGCSERKQSPGAQCPKVKNFALSRSGFVTVQHLPLSRNSNNTDSPPPLPGRIPSTSVPSFLGGQGRAQTVIHHVCVKPAMPC